MLAELSDIDVQGRIHIASKLVPKLEALVVYMGILCNKQIDPSCDLKNIEIVNDTVKSSLKLLSNCPEDFFTNPGPKIPRDGYPNPLFALVHFRDGAKRTLDSLTYLRRDYILRGNASWNKWSRELNDFRIARKDLAEFLLFMEDVGFEQIQLEPAMILATSDYEPTLITEEQAYFLKAALQENADRYAVDSNVIYKRACGGPECPRKLRESLIDAGLLESQRGVGVMLTAKGKRVAEFQC